MKKIILSKMLLLFISLTITDVNIFSQVVISQIYGGGGNTGAPYTNDFIELYNRGTTIASLNGWSVQYAPATGTAWAVTNLTNITLNPGQYYLVQEDAGTTTSKTLPTPDVIGTIAMSATAGKVALCSSTTALTEASSTGTTIVDFVGFGSTASTYEGTGAAPAPSNTTSIFRASGGQTDTNINSSNFSAGAPSPRNTSNYNSLVATIIPTFNYNNIYTANGNIILSTTANTTIEIFNANGQKILSTLAIEGSNIIPVSAHGVVLVRIDSRMVKVIL